jgi:hypothetical protein
MQAGRLHIQVGPEQRGRSDAEIQRIALARGEERHEERNDVEDGDGHSDWSQQINDKDADGQNGDCPGYNSHHHAIGDLHTIDPRSEEEDQSSG